MRWSLLRRRTIQDLLKPCRIRSSHSHSSTRPATLELLNTTYTCDDYTNISPSIQSKIGRNLHNRQHHPLNLIRQRIQEFFYRGFIGRSGNPLFAVFDNLSPVVTLKKNFDNLLVPADHPSREPKVN